MTVNIVCYIIICLLKNNLAYKLVGYAYSHAYIDTNTVSYIHISGKYTK